MGARQRQAAKAREALERTGEAPDTAPGAEATAPAE